MAKKHKDFDAATKGVAEDMSKKYKDAMKKAVEVAAKKAEIDLMQKAKSCLEEYYDTYDPHRYTRTETLQYAFLPYSKIKFRADSIRGTVGVEYSAEMLEANMPPPEYKKDGNRISHVGYYGSNNYQPVDAWWVLDNYLRGVHPATNGATTSEDAIYFEIRTDKSPNKKMRDFIKNYEQTFDENVLAELLVQIFKK